MKILKVKNSICYKAEIIFVRLVTVYPLSEDTIYPQSMALT